MNKQEQVEASKSACSFPLSLWSGGFIVSFLPFFEQIPIQNLHIPLFITTFAPALPYRNDGQIYILRGDKIYNAQGALVK